MGDTTIADIQTSTGSKILQEQILSYLYLMNAKKITIKYPGDFQTSPILVIKIDQRQYWDRKNYDTLQNTLENQNEVKQKTKSIPEETRACIECELEECEECPIIMMLQHEQGYDIDPDPEVILEIP